MSALSATAEAFGFWRKVRFLGQNPRIGYQKCNDLRTAKLSKKQLCDRIAVCALAYPLEVNRGKMARRHTRKCRAKSAGPPLDLPSPSSPSSLQTALSSPSRAGCPSPAPRPGRARRRGPVACRRPTGLARRGRGAPPVRPGQACARRAAWGVRADPKRGHQREHGGRGWADGGG
jgi:hypothetical protein